MNTEIRAASRFEEADFDGEQSKPMAVGIDDLLVKSMAALHEYFDHRFDALDRRFENRFEAIDHHFDAIDRRFDALEQRFDALEQRFDTLESLLRSVQNFQIISLISIIATMLAGFAGLLFAALSRT